MALTECRSTQSDGGDERKVLAMLATRLRGTLAPFEWADLSWFPFLEPTIRFEEYLENSHYVVRAELPGVDPAKDVDITYAEGTMRLSVTRTDVQRPKGRSEFHYGSFHRTITLPPGAKEDTIAAKYVDGILEISVLVGEPAPIGKHIPIEIGNGHPTLTAKKS
jgi:HSP20 family protein